jgi:hypothetical protein
MRKRVRFFYLCYPKAMLKTTLITKLLAVAISSVIFITCVKELSSAFVDFENSSNQIVKTESDEYKQIKEYSNIIKK